MENELKKALDDGEEEVVDDTESSESQEAGKVNNVDLHKVMGVPKDAKGVSAAVAVKLRSKADVSSHLYSKASFYDIIVSWKILPTITLKDKNTAD